MSIDDVVLRPRDPRDAEPLGALLTAQQPISGYPIRLNIDPMTFVVRTGQIAAWVLEVDGEIAGHVALATVPPGREFAAAWAAHHGVAVSQLVCVSALFLGVDRTGLGLGGRLFDHAVGEARRLDRAPVLDTVQQPSAALGLYRRRGWIEVAAAEQDWLPGGVMTVAMAPAR